MAAAHATGNPVAGVIMEPVLGEGGIYVLSDEYLRAARAICDEYGALLIFDEVQSVSWSLLRNEVIFFSASDACLCRVCLE